MKNKIEQPKVFISYAWGDDEYQNQVLSLAEKLCGDGIEVVLDKWDLTEGNDTNAFMEMCVRDETITNVLMLLDPIYASKADNHTGGVGTETQIISAKVYQETTQDKFIPIVMKRREDGSVCKPIYLQSRLHFDLSLPEKFESEYIRLVKKLYGVELYEKPLLGSKPEWVDKPIKLSHKTVVTYDSLKKSSSDTAKSYEFQQYLTDISERFIKFAADTQAANSSSEYISLYDETADIRNDYLLLLTYSHFINDASNQIADFFENTYNSVYSMNTTKSEIVIIRIHELFIYTIAFFLKNNQYASSGYLLGKTYFSNTPIYNSDSVDSFHLFYSSSLQQTLDNAICKRDDTNYYSGAAHYWIETIANNFCTKEQFIYADLICFNYAVYGNHIQNDMLWFPITYVYDSQYSSLLSKMGKKLVSHEFVQTVLPLWGYKTIEAFIDVYQK